MESEQHALSGQGTGLKSWSEKDGFKASFNLFNCQNTWKLAYKILLLQPLSMPATAWLKVLQIDTV